MKETAKQMIPRPTMIREMGKKVVMFVPVKDPGGNKQ
jgi:hypothetical protein